MRRDLLLGLCLLVAAPVYAGGSLVIAGGAVAEDNRGLYEAFVEALPAEGPIAIIPAASARPARSAASVREALERWGVHPERIGLYPLARVDDTGTSEVDESLWSGNAHDAAIIGKFTNTAGFWFTGGDQTRIISLLRDATGGETPLLELIRRRLADGAVVGGTSAGAAVMSGVMIAGGDSFTALLEPPAASYTDIAQQEGGRLALADGLALFPYGVVDQHFDRKARLGRLAQALLLSGEQRGFGIDEDTALVVDLDRGRGIVAGRGSVTVLSGVARGSREQTSVRTTTLGVDVLAPGAVIDLVSGGVDAGDAEPVLGREAFSHPPLQGGGMALANGRLAEALGYDLLDNSAAAELRRLSVDERGRAVLYRFRQTGRSRGYLHTGPGGEHYTITGVELAIELGPARNYFMAQGADDHSPGGNHR